MSTTKPKNSQVNARIDADLKREGDEGLAAAGLTPTQAVRAVWELAARHKDQPEKIIAALFPDKKEADEKARRAEYERKKKLIDDAPKIAERYYKKAGLPWPPQHTEIFSLPYKELRELAYDEELLEQEEMKRHASR